ncbi:phytoene/squalene synthase family protein [Patescibacteria group bacterium]|nr:phytoene/squalene synthase family protein [Patescibacteria group bacterium]
MKAAAIEKARRIEKRHGTSYYLATLFLPREYREAVFILYAFVRIPDEIVDNPAAGSDPAVELDNWKHDWIQCYDTGETKRSILEATREVFLRYHIPLPVSIEFIDAMLLDLTKTRYTTYEELQSYMRGSAQVVGVMLTYIFGYRDERAFPRAEALGEAMQLTNFLRDVREDYDERGRIYLPQSEMTKHGVTEDMIKHHATTPEFIALMKQEIARARRLYTEAEPGVALLSPKARRAVILASRFYAAILDQIERQHYNVFTKRARVSKLRKCLIILRTYVNN